jgi:hypothetical protein
MKEQIEKIIRDYISFDEDYGITDVSLSAQEITDHVFQFIEWFTGKDSPVTVLYGDQKERFASTYHDYTIEELYNFWYSNVFSKTKKG